MGPLGPVGPKRLAACLEHIRDTPRDWDILELRWQGAAGPTRPNPSGNDGRRISGLSDPVGPQSIVDLAGTWDPTGPDGKGAWLRRFRHDERRVSRQASELCSLPARRIGPGDGSPRWDLTTPAKRWPGTVGRAMRATGLRCRTKACGVFARAARGRGRRRRGGRKPAVVGGVPVAFIYGYHYRGCVYGLRRGYDARLAPRGRATYCWPVRCAIVSRAATGCTTWAWARWPANDIS